MVAYALVSDETPVVGTVTTPDDASITATNLGGSPYEELYWRMWFLFLLLWVGFSAFAWSVVFMIVSIIFLLLALRSASNVYEAEADMEEERLAAQRLSDELRTVSGMQRLRRTRVYEAWPVLPLAAAGTDTAEPRVMQGVPIARSRNTSSGVVGPSGASEDRSAQGATSSASTSKEGAENAVAKDDGDAVYGRSAYGNAAGARINDPALADMPTPPDYVEVREEEPAGGDGGVADAAAAPNGRQEAHVEVPVADHPRAS